MAQVLDMAIMALQRAETSVETSSHNISNINSTAYKRKISFDTYVSASQDASRSSRSPSDVVDDAPGKEMVTENPFDLAIQGKGFFVVKSDDSLIYTRDGQFHRDDAGRLLNQKGQVLQADGGGDIILTKDGLSLGHDGSIQESGQAVQRIAVVQFGDKSLLRSASGQGFTAPDDAAQPVENPSVRQGALEGSNVSTGDEMVTMMAALRRAETGQRLVQVYDDLMARAISAFGG